MSEQPTGQYRQGDIFFIRIAELDNDQVSPPADHSPTEAGDVTVGYGEVTGHSHVIDKATWRLDDEQTLEDMETFANGETVTGDVHVTVHDWAELRHEEHSTIEIPPGIYKVVRQRQFDPTTAKGFAPVLD